MNFIKILFVKKVLTKKESLLQQSMFNNFFTPEQISPRKKQSFRLNFTQAYDFSSLLQKDLFQIVSPHVQSIMDQKRKIISWLKKITLIQRMHILTYTNKEFVCLIRAMYQKKQQYQQDESFATFTISHIEQTDEFDLVPNLQKHIKPTKQYILAEDDLLSNVRIMNRYTQFDSITFSESYIRNVDNIFHLFDVLGDGVSHELTLQDYDRLKKMNNSVMFYDSTEEHCLKRVTIGRWIIQVFMKHISMKYLQYQQNQKSQFQQNQLPQKFKEIQKFWKIISPQTKNQIIRKVLPFKLMDLYQQHHQIIKVTRNGFPKIQQSLKVPQLIKQIKTANQKQIVNILYYTQLNETLQSHSILKYYITLEMQEEIKKYNELQKMIIQENKMKKKGKKQNKSNFDTLLTLPMKHEQIKEIQKKKSQQTGQYSQIKAFSNKKLQFQNKGSIVQNSQQLQQSFPSKPQHHEIKYIKEISQTQQIICIQSNLTNIEGKQIQAQTQVINILDQKKNNKKKKKKNNKKKNSQEQQSIKPQEQSLESLKQQQDCHEQQISENVSNSIKIEPKLENDEVYNKVQGEPKYIHQNLNDRISQKSSDTTNDNNNIEDEKNMKKQRISSRNSKSRSNSKSSKSQQNEHKSVLGKQIKSNELEIKKQASSSRNDPLSVILNQSQKSINFYNKQRKIVLNRLSYIFTQHQLSFKLYGSSACDMALPNSDIDIVVDPSIVNYFYFSYSSYRKKIINSLQYIQKMFQKHQWTDQFLLIQGATIPLLTFTVNPNIDFQFENGSYLYNNKKQINDDIKISVDITIEPYINMTDEIPMHLGVESTELLKEWITTFPYYRQMLTLLKIFTKNNNLNKMYHGGIGSFMQSIILVGFYKHLFMSIMKQTICWNDFQLKKQKLQQILPEQYNLTEMFKQYCIFIRKFQQDKQTLDINSPMSITIKPQTILKEQLAIVNPLTGKVMSQRCTTFDSYKKILQKIYDLLNCNNKSLQHGTVKEELEIMFHV